MRTLAFAALFAAAPALATEAEHPTFETLDANHDKSIDATEAAHHEALAHAFAAADHDKSGGISHDEYVAWSGAHH